jgi:hypothetical protein
VIRLFLVVVLSVIATWGWGANPAVGTFVPTIPIEEALRMALQHVKEGKIDTTGQYVRSVTLQHDAGNKPGEPYWFVQWAWVQPRMGGEMGVMVYMDGTIVAGRLGP